MKQRIKQLPLFLRLMAWIMLFWFGLLSVTTLVTMHHTRRTFQEKVDEILVSTVTTLAEAPSVLEVVRTGLCPPDLVTYLTNMVRHTEDLDYITIADRDSIRLYHIDPAFVGLPFEGGDQHRALAGESYLSDTGTVNFEDQRRAFHPIRETDGTVVGFVMASTTHTRLDQLQNRVYDTYFHLFLVLTGCSLAVGLVLAVYLGRHLRGVRPEDLLRVYLTQNDILNALDEGLISYDNTGRVRLVNAAAARMLGHREDLMVGRQVDDLLLAGDGSTLRGREDRCLQSDRPNILVRPVRLPDSNLWARQVLILEDKSEIMRYAEELGGTRHMLSTLRANTHEFSNKLQVISGLLQMDYIDEARTYIGTLSSVQEHILGPVMQHIRNSSVAALILGKENNMRELGIDLTLLRNSRLPEVSRYLGTDELVTVVGNLLENAMEAVNAVPAGAVRLVALQITEDDLGLLILVSDTGEGIARENLPRIFEGGFSTKARTGRGVGMKLIREITDRCGGSIEVDTEPGSGTTISIIFSREQGGSL